MPTTSWATPSDATAAWAAYAAPAPQITPGDVSRTAVGLLAWSLASSENDGSIASRSSFTATPWKAQGKSPTNPALAAEGSLSYSGPLFNLLNALLNTSVDSRVTFLVQARCRSVGAQGDLLSGGPAVRCEPTGITGTSTVSAIRHTHPASADTRNFGIEEIRNDTSARASLVSAIGPSDTTQRSAVWSNGTQAAAYDFAQGLTSSITLAVQNVSARAGLVFHDATASGAGQLLCPEWIACADRFVTVGGSGLTDGDRVRVQRTGSATSVEAVVSGLTATIDMLAETLDGAYTSVGLFDASGALLSTYTPGGTGVWPGDVYDVQQVLGVATTWSTPDVPSTTWTALP